MTPAPTKPTPLATLAAIREGSHLIPKDAIWTNPCELQTVNAEAPIATKAIVRTPAECLANERSLPSAAPSKAAQNKRRLNFSSTAAETGEATTLAEYVCTAAAVFAVKGSAMVEATARIGANERAAAIPTTNHKILRIGSLESSNESEEVANNCGSWGCILDLCSFLGVKVGYL